LEAFYDFAQKQYKLIDYHSVVQAVKNAEEVEAGSETYVPTITSF